MQVKDECVPDYRVHRPDGMTSASECAVAIVCEGQSPFGAEPCQALWRLAEDITTLDGDECAGCCDKAFASQDLQESALAGCDRL
jgi:hypothetical protein